MAFPAYRHTQKSVWMPILLGVGTLIPLSVLLGLHVARAHAPIISFVLVVLALTAGSSAVVFRQLTVDVSPDGVRFGFGLGVGGGRLALEDITDCRAVKNPWWYGYGVHWIPRLGMLYNVGGPDAVEIHCQKSRTIRLGTDRPVELEGAIRAALDERNRLTSLSS